MPKSLTSIFMCIILKMFIKLITSLYVVACIMTFKFLTFITLKMLITLVTCMTYIILSILKTLMIFIGYLMSYSLILSSHFLYTSL
jgi:hypothetical protein